MPTVRPSWPLGGELPAATSNYVTGRVAGKEDEVRSHDGRQQSFLHGGRPLLCHGRPGSFVEKGVDPDTFAFAPVNKTFLFGGDNRSLADWCVHLPVWVGGTKGRIQCFLVPGEMPILIGRPILKALRVKMDYDTDQVSIMGEPWTKALQGPKGEYVLALDDGLSEDTLEPLWTPKPTCGPRDARHPSKCWMRCRWLKQATGQLPMNRDLPQDGLTPVVELPLQVNLWKSIGDGLNRTRNDLDRVLESAYRASESSNAIFWEVYSGSGQLSVAMAHPGFHTRTFDLPEWDFAKPKCCSAFLELLDTELPHVVWVSPPSAVWMPVQDTRCCSDQDREHLSTNRDYRHHTHLKFARRIFLRMSQYGVVVVEQPAISTAWATPALNDLMLTVTVDHCALGAIRPNLHRIETPIKKATTIAFLDKLPASDLDRKPPGATEGAYYALFVCGGCDTEEALPASDVDIEEYSPSDGGTPENDDLYPRKDEPDELMKELDLPTTEDMEAEARFGRGQPVLAQPARATSSEEAPLLRKPAQLLSSRPSPVLLNGSEKWRVLVPLQSQMTATIPRMNSAEQLRLAKPRGFFPEAILSERCLEHVEVFRSKEKPKKLTFLGSDGQQYPFLCKAEKRGDLRKDSRLMEFAVMVNQLLAKSPDANRRNLEVRTFQVVILSEKCGLIEWVPNTKGLRPLIDDLWKGRKNPRQTLNEVKEILDRSKDVYETFIRQVAPRNPPILHRWFARSGDPSAWLAKRTLFSQSQALWCMLGYLVGLGDRHGENILLDTESGRMVHVDFDCLFGKGMLLEKPEMVPFRLTQNCVAAMGVTGVEGTFRQCCEVTMEVLRDRANTQTLLSVLHVFVADPLLEMYRKPASVEHRVQTARDTIGDVEKKLNGMLNVGAIVPARSRDGRESVLSKDERLRSLLGFAVE
eukprot:s250_g18.t1